MNSSCGNNENGNLLTISSNGCNGVENDLLTINTNGTVNTSNNGNCNCNNGCRCNNDNGKCNNNCGCNRNSVSVRASVIPNNANGGTFSGCYRRR